MRIVTSIRPAVRAIGAASVASLLMVSGAAGYEGEVPANVTVSVSGTIAPGEPIPITATVLGPSGTGVPDVTVGFTITAAPPGAQDVLSASSVVTDADGEATVHLTLDAVVGARTVEADAEGEAAGAVTVVLEATSLPNTAAPAGPQPATLAIGVLALSAVLTVAWTALAVGRPATRRGSSQ